MSLKVVLGADISKFEKDMKRAERILTQEVGKAALDLSKTMLKVSSVITGATLAIGAGFAKLGANFEEVAYKLKLVINDTDEAGQTFKRLQDRFTFSRLSFSKLDEATRKFAGLGFSAKQAVAAVATLEDAAFSAGEGEQDVEKMERAIEQFIARGTITDRSFISFTQAGIDAWKYLSEGIGASVDEVRERVSKGMLSMSDVMKHIFTGMYKEFGGSVEKMSRDTLNGAVIMTRNISQILAANLGSKLSEALNLKGLFNAINRELLALNNMIQSIGLRETFEKLIPMEYLKAGLIGIGVTVVGILIPALKLLAIKAWTAVLPLAIIGAKAAIIGTTFAVAYKNWEQLSTVLLMGVSKIIKAWSLFETALRDIWSGLVTFVMDAVNAIISGVIKTLTSFANIIPASLGGGKIRNAMSNLETGWIGIREGIKEAREEFNKTTEEYKKNADEMDKLRLDNLFSYKPEQTKDDFIDKYLEGIKKKVSNFRLFPDEFYKGTSDSDIQELIDNKLNLSTRKGSDLIMEETREQRAAERRKRMAENLQKDLNDTWLKGNTTRLQYLDMEYEKEKAIMELLKNDFEDYELAKIQAEERYQNARKEIIQQGYDFEDNLTKYQNDRNIKGYAEYLDSKKALYIQSLEDEKEAMSTYHDLMLTANKTTLGKLADIYSSATSQITDTFTNIVMGVDKVGDAFQKLGQQILTMIVRQRIEQEVSAKLSQALNRKMVSRGVSEARVLEQAWKKAAIAKETVSPGSIMGASARVNTVLGVNAVPFAKGGVVTKPTLAMIGETGEKEAVIPLSRLEGMMKSKSGDVVVNVVNNTGVQADAKQTSRFDGQKFIVDVVLDAYQRNINGIQEVLGGGR